MPDSSLLRAGPGARVETPLCRLAQELAALTGWRRYGLGFLLGALLAGALPPVDLMPLIFIAFPGLLWLDDGSAGRWASARLGYAFGLGFFAAGLYWIAAALVRRSRPFLVGPAVRSVRRSRIDGAVFRRRARPHGIWRAAGCSAPAARICLFAVAWSAAEWLRGHLLTGFPWNLVGYIWAGGFPGSLGVPAVDLGGRHLRPQHRHGFPCRAAGVDGLSILFFDTARRWLSG